jgi:hypothetical protein
MLFEDDAGLSSQEQERLLHWPTLMTQSMMRVAQTNYGSQMRRALRRCLSTIDDPTKDAGRH